MPQTPLAPIPVEQQRRLKALAEDAFQRLNRGMALLDLQTLLDLARRRGAVKADSGEAKALDEAYTALEAVSLGIPDPRSSFTDLGRFFDILEELLDEYTGPRPPAPIPPLSPAPPGMSSRAFALLGFLKGMGRHRALIEQLDPDNWPAGLKALATNRAEVKRCRVQLEPPDKLEAALKDFAGYLDTLRRDRATG